MTSQTDSAYLSSRVNPILERLTQELVEKKPNDVVNFMIEWLIRKAGGANAKAIQQLLDEKKKQAEEHKDSSDSSSEEDEPQEVKPLPKTKVQRSGVSAESYGTHNKKEDYVPKVIAKNDEQKNRIRTRLERAFMFQALDEKERRIVIDAMAEKVFKTGDWVIKQGEDGDVLYVVDSGDLDCFKRFTKDGENKYLKTYHAGESFGELSLLYNAPRAASIQAKTDAVLFALDRECFNNIVRDAAVKKRVCYEEFLSKVPILETIDPYEKLQIADSLKPLKFKKGDYVIKQGEKGDTFYIIEEGTASATKKIDGDKEEEVLSYKKGDYFGELSLLREQPRAANVVATSDLAVVVIDRDTFIRVLGPLKEILKRNMDKYIKYHYVE